MREPRCDCCDLPIFSCGKAAERRLLAEQRQERALRVAEYGQIVASWSTKCPVCDELISPGEPIQPTGDGLPWAHAHHSLEDL